MADISNELIRVDSLIPSQLLDDAEELRSFLKAYYTYLNQSGQPSYYINKAVEFRDLDKTVDEFIELIKAELGEGIASRLLADKTNFYKHAKEIYSSKGSIDSFRLIFRLLFNREIEFKLPKEEILIASDGRWRQDLSVFVEVVSGSADALKGKRIQIGLSTITEVVDVRSAPNSTNVFELFITRTFSTALNVGDTVTGDDFEGNIVATTTNYLVMQPGSGFKVGQIFNIQNQSGSGTSVKITAVDDNGGIEKIEFIGFGVNYNTNFFTTISSDDNISADNTQYNIAYDGSNWTVGIDDPVGGFKDEGFISQQDYFLEEYASLDYSGQVIAQFVDDRRYETGEIAIGDQSVAFIQFFLGALAEYSGYYASNKGFLSDAIFLQDNYYYQQFSYVINVDQQIDQYRDVIDQTVHPAGSIMFGQFDITFDIDLGASIEDPYKRILVPITDSVQMTDRSSFLINLEQFQDTVTITESLAFQRDAQPLSDSIGLSDSGNLFINTYALNYFAEEYTETTNPVETF